MTRGWWHTCRRTKRFLHTDECRFCGKKRPDDKEEVVKSPKK